MDRIESIILRGLMHDEQFMRRVLPFINAEYFDGRGSKTERNIFLKVKDFIDKFNTLPTKESLLIDLEGTHGVAQDDLDEIGEYLDTLEVTPEQPNIEWLVQKTEEWCQERAIHNAVLEVITILDGTNTTVDKGIIPKLLQDALGVSFDPHVGHDYLEDADERYEFYHKIDSRIPFHLDYMNMITKNGVPSKTLNICLAGTNVGKSLFMCDLAANYLMQGKKVLYITMEMAQERIAERIDANLMDRPLDELAFVPKESFKKNINRIKERTKGTLIIKEYPTAQAHVGHFRHLLNELNLKKQFKPDAIFIDYLNICASSRVKASSSGGMYELVKSIAEELRGLAVEFDVPIWSATQMNRAGFNNSDPDLTNTSESFGLPATADFMFALINSDELKGMNQLLVKILKNRHGDVNMRNKENGKFMNKFVVGIDRSKQKLFNLEESAQKDITQDDDIDTIEDGESAPTLAIEEADGPVFDIDKPTKDRPFKSNEEAAERRRNSTPLKADGFKPQSAFKAAAGAKKLKV